MASKWREKIDLTDEDFDLNVWRKAINPFQEFGFLYGSGFHFLELNQRKGNKVSFEEHNELSSGEEKKEEAEDELRTKLDLNKEDTAKPVSESYHVEFFNHIIEDIKDNDTFRFLFSKDDLVTIKKFQDLSPSSQELYVRLFQRKRSWIREVKIQYKGIDCADCLKCLLLEGFLKDESNLSKIEEVFDLLSVAELRTLLSDLKMGKNNKNKNEMIKLLKGNCKKQKTIFGSMDKVIMKRAKKVLGHCIQVDEVTAGVFSKIIKLFQMFVTLPSSDNNNIMYHLLQVKIGQIRYPEYKAEPLCIFTSREDFLNYVNAVELETEFFSYVETKAFDQAYSIFIKVYDQLKDLIASNLHVNQRILPWLEKYSTLGLLFRVCRYSVTVLEKLKKYEDVIGLLDTLIDSCYLHPKHRGMLWERKIIDCERHLHLQDQASLSIQNALKDPMVRGSFQYIFKQRLDKSQKKKKGKKETTDYELEYYKNVKINYSKECLFFSNPFTVVQKITKSELLKGTAVLDTTSSRRAIFMSPSTSGNSMSYVEQYVMEHYKEKGFVGVHDEGSVVMTLFVLLFWNIIFQDIPGVFLSKYQAAPLDFFTDMFYVNRKNKIDERLDFVYHATEEELKNEFIMSWEKHHGCNVVGVNWSIMPSKYKVVEVGICLSAKVLGGICEIYCKDFRSRRGGFPDLMLWNRVERQCKIIEVKGPGDKLSSKQIVWLDILCFLGADAIVCHVTGVGAKRKFISIEKEDGF